MGGIFGVDGVHLGCSFMCGGIEGFIKRAGDTADANVFVAGGHHVGVGQFALLLQLGVHAVASETMTAIGANDNVAVVG